MSGQHGWIGVDLDGTLAKYDGWVSAAHIGEPVGEMLFRVKKWLAEGREVRIFTARMWPQDEIAALDGHGDEDRHVTAVQAITAIRAWCLTHVGQVLTITCVKDYSMIELWDDRAVQVEPNTGRPIGQSTRGLA